MWYRQLAAGRYHWPDFAAVKREIDGAELTLLLAGVDVAGAKRYKRFHYRAGETISAPDSENNLENRLSENADAASYIQHGYK